MKYPRITGLGLIIYGKHIEKKREIVKKLWKLFRKEKQDTTDFTKFMGGGGC